MKTLCTIFGFFMIGQFCSAQADNRVEGPLITGYGNTWSIDSTDLEIDPSQNFHMIFDIARKPENPSQLNASINTIARFLNMHINAGVQADKIKVVAVIHGSAGNDIMQDQFHEHKFGVVNPNKDLISKLGDAGVEIFLCGQTMNSRGLDRKQHLPEVQVALSAMTVINKYVSEGYTLIKF